MEAVYLKHGVVSHFVRKLQNTSLCCIRSNLLFHYRIKTSIHLIKRFFWKTGTFI